jgi:hypothetical protein
MPPRSDRIRQLAVTVSFVAGLIGTLAGVGLIGTEVNRSAGGALRADATLLTPATQAFSIWSVIYVGLTAYLIWQWLPAQAHSRTARETGWWAAASLLLNGAWLGVTQAGWLWVSVLVIALLTYVLAKLCLTLVGRGPNSLTELLIVYVTFGLYLGWVCVATVANVTAAAVGTGARLGEAAPVLAVVVLLVAGAIGVLLARVMPGQPAIGVAMAWGLAWIAVGRLLVQPQSLIVGVVAALVAAGVLAAHVFGARVSVRG